MAPDVQVPADKMSLVGSRVSRWDQDFGDHVGARDLPGPPTVDF